MRAIMVLAYAIAALVLAGTTPSTGQAAARLPAVRIAIAPLGAEEVLRTEQVHIALHALRRSRVRAAVSFVSEKGTVRLYSRRVTIARGRTRRIRLALPVAARHALEGCAASRLEVSVKSGDRRRRAVAPMTLGPPRCGRFFGPQSVWNTPLAPDAAVDPDSGQIVAALSREVAREFDSSAQPTVNTANYSAPIYTVPQDQPTVPVGLDANEPDLARSFQAVPLPAAVRPAPGTDAHLVLWQPSRDVMWEFWRLRRTAGGWRAGWGGRIDNASASAGHYSGAHAGWGATASSLALAGGLITAGELSRGVIQHALAMAVPHPRAGEFAFPAQRTDGDNTSASSLPEGARLRLDPKLDLDALGLPPPVLAMARAAQQYGILIRDGAGNVAFYAEDPAPLGVNPYPALFGGARPQDLLRLFPWDRLKVVRMDLRRDGAPERPLAPVPCQLACG
jgi:hypothetical protein